MSAIEKYNDLTIAGILQLGGIFKASGYFQDVQQEAQAVVKILYGRELGFSPVVSMMGIHVIEGKPALSSNLMATLIKRSGKYDYRVNRWDSEHCDLIFREKIDGKWQDVGEASFTIADAQRAGIQFKTYKGYPTSWAKYPKAMLFARALSQGLRAYCPDVSASPLYVPEELGAEVNEEGDVIGAKNGGTSSGVVSQHIETPRLFKKQAEGTPITTSSIDTTGADYIVRSSDIERIMPSEAAEIIAKAETATEANAFDQQLYPPPPDGPYIAKGNQTNFHVQCKKVLPAEMLSADKDILIYRWLLDNGYQKNGQPGAEWIPAAGWLETRERAMEWLRKQ